MKFEIQPFDNTTILFCLYKNFITIKGREPEIILVYPTVFEKFKKAFAADFASAPPEKLNFQGVEIKRCIDLDEKTIEIY